MTATFEITAPDGTQYHVDGPDGANENDALQQVMAQHPAAQAGIFERIGQSDMVQALRHPIAATQDLIAHPGELLKSAGAVGRGAFDAAIGIPGMAADAAWQLKNRLTGTSDNASPLPTQVVNAGLDQAMGTPQGGNAAIRGVSGMMLGSRIPLPGQPEAPAAAAAQEAPSPLTGAQQQAQAGGEALGMRTTPGQASGSVPVQQLEAKLESSPITSAPFARLKAANQSILNTAAAKAIGENSDTVDSSVLGRAVDRLGQVFESVGDPKSIRIVDPDTATAALGKIDSDFSGLLPGNASITSNPLVQQFKDLSDSGAFTGEQLQQLSSKLGKAAAKQMTTPAGDRDMGQALYQVKNLTDDLLQQGLDGQDATAFSAARQQYRNLMLLTKRAASINPSTGDVNVRSLASALQSADRPGYLYGNNQSDLYNAVRFGQAFQPVVGNSGTATRLPMSLHEMLLGIPGNIASSAYLSPLGRGAVAGYQGLSHTPIPAGLLTGSAPLLVQGLGSQ